ncbi:MAG TPA: hypothetical protein VK040_07315 [Balneolaceae bacterium]|nr:hypothetical protein [Balneolaceae bacterium]
MERKFSGMLWISLFVFAALNIVLVLLFPIEEGIGWTTGYMLGLLMVIIHLIMSIYNKNSPKEKFNKVYLINLALRFLIVCAFFVLILIATNIDEFTFTVGFVISYLFHSVNEVIFLNRKFSN